MDISIVIICKNDAAGLERTWRSVSDLDADILVYDFGSTDESKETAVNNGARFFEGSCDKYEHMRFHASRLAKYDWILMLHPDEIVDTALFNALKEIDFSRIKQVYRIRFKNYFGNRWLRHGELGRYSDIRLANREGIETDGESVHEQIFYHPGILIRSINGYILHRTVKNTNVFAQKVIHDALLWAVKSHRQGKKAGMIKLFFSPKFSFIKNYFFKLGFLDGWEGYVCAKMRAWYTFLKYARLRELNDTLKKPT
jgi:glycosyltransferase involved in cell wall biosynthesis